MNAIKEHVRRPFLISARSPRLRARDGAEPLVFAQLLNAGTKPERRTGEARNLAFFGQIVNRNSIGERPSDRFVDEKRLAGLDHRNRFLQMDAPIHAFEQDHIHLLEKFRNRIHDLNAHPAQFLSELAHPVAAGRNVCAAGITGHDADP